MLRTPILAAATALLTLLVLAPTGFAQAAPTRVVVLPFDASRSLDALGLVSAAAVQRAFNQVDGLYAPPVGDALLVLQRADHAGLDGIAAVERLFQADAVVLARVSGQSQLRVELVVVVDGDDRESTVTGTLAELPRLWREVAETSLRSVGIALAPVDLAQLRGALTRAPSLPALGPLGVAAARLPGARLADLETALALDGDSAWLLAEAGRVAALQGHPERAAQLVRDAAEAAPDVADVRVLEGIVLANLGERAVAAAAYEAALAINPTHALALAGLADLSDDPEERQALLQRAVTAAPRLVDAHLSLAAVQTDPQRRLQVLRRAAERVPDSLAIQRALQETVLAAGDPRGALALLQQAATDAIGRSAALYALAAQLPDVVATDALAFVREGRAAFPESVTLAIAEADLLVAAGDLEAAETTLREVVSMEPDAVAAIDALATVLGRTGRLDEAEALLTEALGPSDALERRIVEMQLASGRARAALARLAPRIEAGEGDPLLRTYHGIALGRVGRVDEARAVLEAVRAEAPDVTLAARALNVLEQQRRIVGDDDALALEGDAAVAFEQGLSGLERGDWVTAADGFARAREHGDAGLLAFYQGYALQRSGDQRAAIAAYDDARDQLGDNDVLLSNLGFAHLQLGRFDRALDALQAAVATNPENPQAHFNLGMAQLGVARFVEAVASFERTVALAPELAASVEPFLAEARRRSQR